MCLQFEVVVVDNLAGETFKRSLYPRFIPADLTIYLRPSNNIGEKVKLE